VAKSNSGWGGGVGVGRGQEVQGVTKNSIKKKRHSVGRHLVRRLTHRRKGVGLKLKTFSSRAMRDRSSKSTSDAGLEQGGGDQSPVECWRGKLKVGTGAATRLDSKGLGKNRKN